MRLRLNAEPLTWFLVLHAAAFCGVANADSITIAGNLTSDGTAVGTGDPVITDPSTINWGDSYLILLTYDPSSFIQTGNSFVLTDSSLTLQFDGYQFGYSTAAGNYLQLSILNFNAGSFDSFLFCSSIAGCSTSDYLDLYTRGAPLTLQTLSSLAGTLTGDPSASPSDFEFLRNFSDGSQTDLQGTLAGASAVSIPEPGTWAPVAFGAMVLILRQSLAGGRGRRA